MNLPTIAGLSSTDVYAHLRLCPPYTSSLLDVSVLWSLSCMSASTPGGGRLLDQSHMDYLPIPFLALDRSSRPGKTTTLSQNVLSQSGGLHGQGQMTVLRCDDTTSTPLRLTTSSPAHSPQVGVARLSILATHLVSLSVKTQRCRQWHTDSAIGTKPANTHHAY